MPDLDTAEYRKLALIAANVPLDEIPPIIDTATYRKLLIAQLAKFPDTEISNPQVGDTLVWNGTKWVNSPAGQASQIVYLQSDFSVPPQTAPVSQDVIQVPIQANTRYRVDIVLCGRTIGANTIQCRLSCPSGTTGYGSVFLASGGISSYTDGSLFINSWNAFISGGGTPGTSPSSGLIFVGSTSGNLILQARVPTGSGTSATMKPGTFLSITKF